MKITINIPSSIKDAVVESFAGEYGYIDTGSNTKESFLGDTLLDIFSKVCLNHKIKTGSVLLSTNTTVKSIHSKLSEKSKNETKDITIEIT